MHTFNNFSLMHKVQVIHRGTDPYGEVIIRRSKAE